MAARFFLDTNILLDFLQQREGFVADAKAVLALAETKRATLVISALSVVNAHYSYCKSVTPQTARQNLERLCGLLEVVSLDSSLVLEGLADRTFTDFEDRLQYQTAVTANCEVIVSRNQKDYKTARLPVLTPRELLASL